MKKLIFAAIISSVAFGASAEKFNKKINFKKLEATDSSKIVLKGKVPERCLLRINKRAMPNNILKYAKNAHGSASKASNKRVDIGHLKAWCNYGSDLKITFRARGLEGKGTHNENEIINYKIFLNNSEVMKTTGTRTSVSKKVENNGVHLKNKVKKMDLAVKPQGSGFAKAGKYRDVIRVHLKAKLSM
ncbi:hypothetical protein AB4455_16355 [Vibrio sp. 10N.261.46.E12]|uniref:hypothetical protein n=1 Tax=unclassified Vibrio TaxID=2614977 RepID=UPI0009779611|nr:MULTISPECIES: hypothetical protein [unclassified Vibrio]OMO34248.1 hypothetical protein BH584_13225 [Vibrio sp. 10N.261.45.E1]PMJ28165.1 hypothetical protein BCU27_05525 [Vibrio sp. 10N.286.45.B6]PML89100.1 hypothetical protein BCT66_08850 [Vibrio sp. 10N.261.49.E11]PMM70994.1 hypothetical protein BCT48_08545 [Vibrio sp. 10N.261.46.F12]PMM90066.1 hypothetical protein BCT46_04020 [Vibrio sp. 10N.261.46.E8]